MATVRTWSRSRSLLSRILKRGWEWHGVNSSGLHASATFLQDIHLLITQSSSRDNETRRNSSKHHSQPTITVIRFSSTPRGNTQHNSSKTAAPSIIFSEHRIQSSWCRASAFASLRQAIQKREQSECSLYVNSTSVVSSLHLQVAASNLCVL